MKNGAAWISPKVVFCNADITKILGRVSYTQMKADRDVPLRSTLQTIANDPNALDSLPPPAPAAAKTDSAGATDQTLGSVNWIMNNGIFLAIGVLVVILLMAVMGRRAR